MAATAIADSGALFAAANEGDPAHERTLTALERPDLSVVVPALAVGELSYLVGSRLGSKAEATMLRELGRMDVELPTVEDWGRIGDLVDEYADFPLGGVDASVVALAERLETPIVITLDRRHFSAIRPRHCEALQLLPE